MKYLFILLSFVLFSCTASKKQKQDTANTSKVENTSNQLVLQKAESGSFKAANAMQGSGTKYLFHLLADTDQEFSFDKIWVGDQCYYVEITNFTYLSGTPFKRGDVVNLQATKYTTPPPNVRLKGCVDAPPIDFPGDALIPYQSNGETYYIQVGEINKRGR